MKKIALKVFGLCTILEAAKRAEVNPQTIRNWIAAESLAVVAIPGDRESYLIRLTDLKRLLPLTSRPKKGRPKIERKVK